ncbi:hypothetical protein BT69DRAFT_280194 [Atractiella rhizophila]|nr:hypothetical protein BT69DRAFT_280194 [Atractiella rhizophila]
MIERFADDHHILVEPAVAALALFYADGVPELLKKTCKDLLKDRALVFVIVVCGGIQESMAKWMEWKRRFDDVALGVIKVFRGWMVKVTVRFQKPDPTKYGYTASLYLI